MTDESARSALVDSATLSARLDDPSWVLFDCRFNLMDPTWGRKQFENGHIPGACYAHLDEDLSAPTGPGTGRHPLPDADLLMNKLGSWALRDGAQAVVYDDLGGAFAVRLWWLLSHWLGHRRVAVLDGGLGAWTADGRALSTSPPPPASGTFTGQPNQDAWVRTTDLVANLKTGRLLVIDARASERFRGELEPIDPVAGHIPGAINLPLTGNLDQNGRFLSAKRLRERFLGASGGRPPTAVVHSCGSGVNACHNLLAMEIAGLQGSRIYAGSWSEWIRSPERPIATG